MTAPAVPVTAPPRVSDLKTDEITWTGMAPTSDRPSMASWLDAAGIATLGATSTPEDIEAVLVRLRELLPPDLDDLSRETLRADVQRRLRDQKVRHTAKLLATALAVVRTPKSRDVAPRVKAKLQGRALQFEQLEPWPQAVDGAALLDDLAATFERFVALPPHASTAIALWVLHTYTIGAAFVSPILAITSPTKRCGKTVLLIVLGSVVMRRLFSSNVTPAVLFRAIEQYAPALLIDEADTFVRDSDELRGVLNSGHTRTTATVIRAVGDDHDPRMFSTWCPKAIALIGRLPGTLEDRAIQIAMRRRVAADRVERLRQDQIDGVCLSVRRRAVRWSVDILPSLEQADPGVPSVLNDRAADCWRPLLAIADAAGGDWPTRARQAAEALSATDDDQDVRVELLRDVADLLAQRDDAAIASTDLVAALVALDHRPWATWRKSTLPITPRGLAALLGPLGVHPDQRRIGDKAVRSYRRAAFDDAFERYLPPVACVTRDSANDSGPQVAISMCDTDPGCHTCTSVTEPSKTASCHAVTHREEESGDFDDDEYRG